MAKLRVTPELLVEALFGDTCPSPSVHIRGATFDAVRQVVIFDIDGPDVPSAEYVDAIFTVQRKTVKFKPV